MAALAAGDTAPPGGRPPSGIEGRLFQFYAKPRFLSAHMSLPESVKAGGVPKAYVVVIGGLTSTPPVQAWVGDLCTALAPLDASVVQPYLTSCGNGFGQSSLEQDCKEIDQCIGKLKPVNTPIVLIGHSTGCQDIVAFLKEGRHKARIKAVVLAAPVSDRDVLPPGAAFHVKYAKEQTGNPKFKMMPTKIWECAFTQYRVLSLWSEGGDEDLFSTEFDESWMEEVVGHCAGTPCLAMWGSKEPNIPPGIDLSEHAARLSNALGGADRTCKFQILEGAGHDFGGVYKDQFITAVIEFLGANSILTP
jgi:pimeloyl-ACP methyl ester carboxylesterase